MNKFLHLFNKPTNYRYFGMYPDKQYYCCNKLTNVNNVKFSTWYEPIINQGFFFF